MGNRQSLRKSITTDNIPTPTEEKAELQSKLTISNEEDAFLTDFFSKNVEGETLHLNKFATAFGFPQDNQVIKRLHDWFCIGSSDNQGVNLTNFKRCVTRVCFSTEEEEIPHILYEISTLSTDYHSMQVSSLSLNMFFLVMLQLSNQIYCLLTDVNFSEPNCMALIALDLCNHCTSHISVHSESETLAASDWLSYINRFAPSVIRILPTFFHLKCLGSRYRDPYFPQKCIFSGQDEVSGVLSRPLSLFNYSLPLSWFCRKIEGPWINLFLSTRDGLSFHQMARSMIGYNGPTIVLIRDVGGNVFGICNSTAWKETNRFYGDSDSFLFKLKPSFEILRAKSRSNGNFFYLNTHGHASSSTVTGIVVGGTLQLPRLHIPESFDNCVYRSTCATFESGNLTSETSTHSAAPPSTSTKTLSSKFSSFDNIDIDGRFEIDCIEVYGCGGSMESIQSSLQAQSKVKQDEDSRIQKARHVDKAKFLDTEFDKEFLLSKTFSASKSGESSSHYS